MQLLGHLLKYLDDENSLVTLGLQSPVMLHCVVGGVVSDVSKDRLAFICKGDAGAKYLEKLGATHPVAED
jgi:hypothetical protein